MKEEKLLNVILDILDNDGVQKAYNYIVDNKGEIENPTSQIYNYLYCLAALCEKREEAIKWLEEAVIQNGYWYRTEVFDDSDLDFIREDKRFIACKKISDDRYFKAKQSAKTMCTWQAVRSANLALVLHGNQQNIEIARGNWDFMNNHEHQVEYIQSCELDSYNLYRWDDDGNGDKQLEEVIASISFEEYENRILCGFSAGCNVILTALAKGSIKCDSIILQSPWIPVINKRLDEIITVLVDKHIKVFVVCGEEDEDCYPLAKGFITIAENNDIDINAVFVKELKHEFPDDFEDIIMRYLNDG